MWVLQIAYCEEQVECRRAVLLAHFGESFDPRKGCHGTCDVCAQHSGQMFEQASPQASTLQPLQHHTALATSPLDPEISELATQYMRGDQQKPTGAQRDVTEEARVVMRLVRAIRQQATLSQVVDVLRGANTRAVKDKGHDSLPEHGACKALRCTPTAGHHTMQGGALYFVDACVLYSSVWRLLQRLPAMASALSQQRVWHLLPTGNLR